MSSLVQTVFRRYVSTSLSNLKKESRPQITKPLTKAVLSVKNNDIINYFKKPEDLKEMSAVQFIKKSDIINAKKGFVKLQDRNSSYYLTIGGESTSKELADLTIKKEQFLCLNDGKKRLSIISVKSKESSAIQDTFDTHSIVEQYEVKPIEGIKPPNVEFECIDLVDEVKDMKEVLINFVKYSQSDNLIKMTNEAPQTFTSKATYVTKERKSGLGILKTSNYIHLVDNNIRASLHHIEVESDDSVLKEFHDLGLLQVYSLKKQPLVWIDQIVDKLKSGDYGEDFSIKCVHDFLEDPNLRMLSEGKTYKYQIVESNGECMYTKITTSAENGDLTCKRFQFEQEKDNSYIIFRVCQVLETTDSDLKPFVDKALVQRVEENHEIVRETDDVIHFMDAWLPMIKHKRLQLESQPEK